jgi:hypothetical protein
VHLALLVEHGRADQELRIRRIGIEARRARGLQQGALLCFAEGDRGHQRSFT